MDLILIQRLERLSERFSGIKIKVNVLEEPPIFLFRRRVVERLKEFAIDIRFKPKEQIADRIYWTAQSLFMESCFKANLDQMEKYDDPKLFKSEAILAGAYLAEFGCVIGTEWEEVVHASLKDRENDTRNERHAGALLMLSGAFGLVPFDRAIGEAKIEPVSIADPRVYERMGRVLSELDIDSL